MEIWKNINSNKDYKVSNLGNVKSIKRGKERILKGGTNSRGYHCVGLCENGFQKIRTVHQLVAIAFLDHEPCGLDLIVDHIDGDKKNNSLSNLQLITNRLNASKGYLNKKTSSKYTGVTQYKKTNKWRSRIYIEGKEIALGLFNSEIEASNAYNKAVNNLINKNK
jgi:hypothetical protein